MQMIGKHDDRIDGEMMPSPCLAECRPQQFDIRGEETRPTVGQIDREEEARAGNEVPPIAGHGGLGAYGALMGFAPLCPSYNFVRDRRMGRAQRNPSDFYSR